VRDFNYLIKSKIMTGIISTFE